MLFLPRGLEHLVDAVLRYSPHPEARIARPRIGPKATKAAQSAQYLWLSASPPQCLLLDLHSSRRVSSVGELSVAPP